MHITVSENETALGVAAATEIAALLSDAIRTRGEANYLVSTGASQFSTFEALLTMPLDWSKVTMFHLDEYVGLPVTHIASFQKYLRERFVDKVALKRAVFVNGLGDVEANLRELGADIAAHPIDVGVIGIGENAHIAFNDPPADFEVESAYQVVTLSDTCKRQQVGEGWFATIDDVPTQAVSMTPQQIMRCRHIIAPVPGKRKAQAIHDTLANDKVDPMVPATLLATHPSCHLFLDRDSASLCTPAMLQDSPSSIAAPRTDAAK